MRGATVGWIYALLCAVLGTMDGIEADAEVSPFDWPNAPFCMIPGIETWIPRAVLYRRDRCTASTVFGLVVGMARGSDVVK